mmetsp:Transcript_25419/g.74649  ORF Transcript_25419/g.74649 Transcript_25419/m.74649 type:complete len:231 (+) Transcript_25419:61-753(+)
MGQGMQAAALFLSYGAMVISQIYGSSIVGLIHGPAAKTAAEIAPDDVAPGTPILELCKGYAAHHFDSISNSFHAAGMTAGVVSVLVGLFGPGLTKGQRLASVLWFAPQWYLPAWVGHFSLQKDVPAVFTYGLTPKSFFTGEFCSATWVFTGGVFEQKPSLLTSAPVAPSYNFGLAVALFVLLGALTPAGALWQTAAGGASPQAKRSVAKTCNAAAIAAVTVVAAIAAAIA